MEPMDVSIVDCPNVDALRSYLEGTLGIPSGRTKLYLLENGQKNKSLDAESDKFTLSQGMDIAVEEVAPVQIRIVTACCSDPLAAVEVSVDDQLVGETDPDGYVQFNAPLGSHALGLKHPALGPRSCGDAADFEVLRVEPDSCNAILRPVEGRLHIYATDPDDDEEPEEEGDGNTEESAPMYDPSFVWLAADPAQVPDDAYAVSGQISCAGKSLLPSQSSHVAAFELGQPEGAVEETAEDTRSNTGCSLARLRLCCHRPGFCWSAKDPSPLAERVAELGGCEFMRVVQCSLVLGFLKPAVSVQVSNLRRLKLPLSEFGEVSVLRQRLAEELDITDSLENLHLEEVGRPGPLTCKYLPGPTSLVCGACSADLHAARELAQNWSEGGDEDQGSDLGASMKLELPRQD
eukprot:TRINITY_DN64315_c0_g1_i1.p1 TRINITY_DN64315_c0_g1~~TRINITY_DN64315_c0_g1_i1.p1  ORF type:complete len:405 (-),score=96.35 TRINITY_DN64315_c0_g1_i1:52-1266(-)